MIHPCIDLAGGKVVQLRQGEELAVELESYEELLRQFEPFPLIHVIDLDAAKGEGSNDVLVTDIVQSRPCRVGGGIRSLESAKRWVNLGAQQVILGSALFQSGSLHWDLILALQAEIGVERLIFALDIKGGQIATHGWRQSASMPVEDAIAQLNHACAGFLVTLVDYEGLLGGTDVDAFLKLRQIAAGTLSAAGGITTLSEVQTLTQAGIGVALGMSLYTGKLSIRSLVEQQQSLIHGQG